MEIFGIAVLVLGAWAAWAVLGSDRDRVEGEATSIGGVTCPECDGFGALVFTDGVEVCVECDGVGHLVL